MRLILELPTLSSWEIVVRLGAAAVLGGAIGVERELRDREAGLRTHLLVSLGSALFTLVSAYGFHDFLTNGGAEVRTDPTRIAAQIVTGIGFLGAGAIIRDGLSVRGLTTAATLWGVAAVGLACGAGYYTAATVATVMILFTLWPLRMIAYRLVEHVRPEERRLVVELEPTQGTTPLLHAIDEAGARVDHFELTEELDRRVIVLELDRVDEELVATLSDLDFVKGVKWRR